MHVYVCACICVYAYVYVCAYAWVCVYMLEYVCTYAYVCTYEWVCVCIYMSMYVHMHEYVSVYACVCISHSLFLFFLFSLFYSALLVFSQPIWVRSWMSRVGGRIWELQEGNVWSAYTVIFNFKKATHTTFWLPFLLYWMLHYWAQRMSNVATQYPLWVKILCINGAVLYIFKDWIMCMFLSIC